MWALPFLTALAPSERYCAERGRRHKRLTDWARQLLLRARRWLPGRAVVAVADSGCAAMDLLAALAPHMACVTRLRLDARLFAPAPPRARGTVGRPQVKGERLPLLRAVLTAPATRWARVTVPGWRWQRFRTSTPEAQMTKVPRRIPQRLSEAACYAA